MLNAIMRLGIVLTLLIIRILSRRRRPAARYTVYATRYNHYRTWIDRAMDLWSAPTVIVAPLLAVIPYILGCLVAWRFSFFEVYVSSLAVYLGVLGISLVLIVIRIASRRIHHALETMRPIFSVTDQHYLFFARLWLKRLASNRGHAVVSFLLFLVFAGVGVWMVFAPPGKRTFDAYSLHPEAFPHLWFVARFHTPAAVLLVIYAGCVALVMGTAVRLLVLGLLFMLALRRLPLIAAPNVVRARLRPIADFFLYASLAWTGCVTLFIFLYGGHFDAADGTIIGVLILFAIVTLAVPQVIFRRSVIASYDNVVKIVTAEVYDRASVRLVERPPSPGRGLRLKDDNWADLTQLAERPHTWIYDSQDVAVWVFGQALAIAIIFAQQALT